MKIQIVDPPLQAESWEDYEVRRNAVALQRQITDSLEGCTTLDVPPQSGDWFAILLPRFESLLTDEEPGYNATELPPEQETPETAD